MNANKNVKKSLAYPDFYNEVFLPEHSQTLTIATHVFGTVMGVFWVIACIAFGYYFWLLLFPLVHAAPGLIGHRLAERNAAVGDLRVVRKDFPLWWFIRANHRLTWDLMSKYSTR
jgi:hypothetical protein